MMTIVLADDHPVVRQGLQALLSAEHDLTVVGEAGRGDEALDAVERFRPNVLILDIKMPGLDGFEVLRRVTRQYPLTRTLVLSMHASGAYVTEALKSGAAGYVLKDTDIQNLVQAVREVAAGGRYLSPAIANLVVEAYLEGGHDRTLDPYETLTMRERQVLRMIGEGLGTAAIAAGLAISPRTVETHKTHLVQKLGLKTQADLIRYSLRHASPSPQDE